jgi:hypothetical protein
MSLLPDIKIPERDIVDIYYKSGVDELFERILHNSKIVDVHCTYDAGTSLSTTIRLVQFPTLPSLSNWELNSRGGLPTSSVFPILRKLEGILLQSIFA